MKSALWMLYQLRKKRDKLKLLESLENGILFAEGDVERISAILADDPIYSEALQNGILVWVDSNRLGIDDDELYTELCTDLAEQKISYSAYSSQIEL